MNLYCSFHINYCYDKCQLLLWAWLEIHLNQGVDLLKDWRPKVISQTCELFYYHSLLQISNIDTHPFG